MYAQTSTLLHSHDPSDRLFAPCPTPGTKILLVRAQSSCRYRYTEILTLALPPFTCPMQGTFTPKVSYTRAGTSVYLPYPPELRPPLSRNSSTQNLRPEEPTLCPLNHLLVDGLWRVVHDNCALLVVDLGVYSSVPDEVHDPLLAFVLVESEAR